MTGSRFSIKLNDFSRRTVTLEEFHPVDHAAYCWDAGWTAFDSEGREYFLSLSGSVWLQPQNEEIGICPAFQKEADRFEALLSVGGEGDGVSGW